MTAAHFSAVVKLAAESGLNQWERTEYEKEIANPNALVFVAIESENVLGFIATRLITSVIEILNIAVSPLKRRRGTGNLLLQQVLQIAREKQITESWLEVRESNYSAQKFYIFHGYEVVGRRKNYYSNPLDDAILMTLRLTEDNLIN